MIAALRAAQPTWSVNALAQVAGVAALQEPVLAWRQQSLDCLRQHAVELWARFTGLLYAVLPTDTTYTLVAVENAAALRQELLRHGLQVRDCTSFGLPQHVRIAARRPEENERLIAAIINLRHR
jgi:histidinol-phosphate/aromatic aminotransferase/cobyric acid decarboxylase-like protein